MKVKITETPLGLRKKVRILDIPEMQTGGNVNSTKLNSVQQSQFDTWKSKLPKNLQYEGDYDLKGLWLENPKVKPSSNLHFPDTYKLPNHPTFSDESKYFNDQTRKFAGNWDETDSSWNYTPYDTTVKKTVIEKKMQTGGNIEETSGLPPGKQHLAKIEAENGEVYENDRGGYTKIADGAPSHEQGGVMIGDAERVLEDTSMDRKDKHSKALLMSPGEVESIFGFRPKRGVSHAKAFELGKDHFNKERSKFQTAQQELNQQNVMDKFSVNAAKQNFVNREFVPNDDDVFNTLFEHQEAIKSVNDIPTGGKKNKYGGFKPKFQTAGVVPYEGGKTPEGSTTPTGNSNKFSFQGGLDAYKKAWQPIMDMSQFNTTQDAQESTYNWLNNNDRQSLVDMWEKQGLTAKGRKMMDPKSKDYNKDFAEAAIKIFDKTGKVKKDAEWNPENLSRIAPAYVDKMLAVRAIAPSTQVTTENIQPTSGNTGVASTNPEPGTPGRQPKQPTVNVNPRFINQPKSAFSEPTRGYDLAPGVMSLLDSMNRDPELYNPAQLHQLKYKLLNPTAAVQANQADFNAAAQALGNQNVGSGVESANMANLLAQKYKANNQIVSDYENRNAAITNQEIGYNTGVRDRQSMADAQSREKYYTDVLKGRDNQRLQKLQAIQDLSRVAQLKARQNRSGNLILKMTPAFDQNGEFNGYQYLPTLPPQIGSDNGEFIPRKAVPKGRTPTAKTRTTTTTKIGDRTIRKTTSE